MHNEAQYLPLSLPVLANAPIDEIIFVFDRCTDQSEAIVRAHTFPFPIQTVTKTTQEWHCPTAEVFEIGFQHATGDLLYTMAADFLVDPRCFNPALFQDADILAFFYYNADPSHYRLRQWYLNFLKKHVNIARLWKGPLAWQSGHMAFTREVWETLHLRDEPSEYDDLQKRALAAGFRYKFVKDVTNRHLRVGLRKDRQILQGMSRAKRGVHPLMVLGHSIVQLKPHVWVSYWHERRLRLFETQKWGKNGYLE